MISRVDQSRFMFFSALIIITGTLRVHAIRNQKHNNPVLSLPLHPQTRNQTARIIADVARVNYLNSRLRNALFKNDSDNIQAPLSLMGGYVAQIWVGQPGSESSLLVDTGSEIVWVKCSPCSQCADPVFDPSKSSSFNNLNCTAPQCSWRGTHELTCASTGRCGFRASYGDGSATSGDFVTETLSFGSSGPVNNVAIGCAHEVAGNANAFDGVLGLGPDSISITSQLKATSFSYCLTPNPESKSSTLDFNSVAPTDSVTVPMVRNPKADIYYYVELTGITVGEVNIPVPPEVYHIGEGGVGGVIVDSGSTLTYLDAGVYSIFLEAFQNHTQALQLVSSPARARALVLYDACYSLPSLSSFQGPAISFQFSNGQSLALAPENYMIQLNAYSYCLAVQPTKQIVSIIGFITQNGMRVTYDLGKNQISFSTKKC